MAKFCPLNARNIYSNHGVFFILTCNIIMLTCNIHKLHLNIITLPVHKLHMYMYLDMCELACRGQKYACSYALRYEFIY